MGDNTPLRVLSYMSNTWLKYSTACSDNSSTQPPLLPSLLPLLLLGSLLLPGRCGSWFSTASEIRSCSL
jgi:hypothetical protein